MLLSSWARPPRISTYCFPKCLRNAYWKTICHYSPRSASRSRSLYVSTCLRTRRRDPCNCRRFYSLRVALVTVDACLEVAILLTVGTFWASNAILATPSLSLFLCRSLSLSLALPCAAKGRRAADCVADWAGWLTDLLLASFYNNMIISSVEQIIIFSCCNIWKTLERYLHSSWVWEKKQTKTNRLT